MRTLGSRGCVEEFQAMAVPLVFAIPRACAMCVKGSTNSTAEAAVPSVSSARSECNRNAIAASRNGGANVTHRRRRATANGTMLSIHGTPMQRYRLHLEQLGSMLHCA